ncbi:MAG: hypothetical protein KC635_06570 [Myxococcales bacterium]|nr:hypothetical protein [Myxococcales bacterium]
MNHPPTDERPRDASPDLGAMGPTRVYRAAGIREAFALVKEEIGADAIILGTRDLQAQGEMDPSLRYEVVAAFPAGAYPAKSEAGAASAPVGPRQHRPQTLRYDEPPARAPELELGALAQDAAMTRQLQLLGQAIKSLESQLASMVDQNRMLRDELSRAARGKAAAEAALTETEPASSLVASGVDRDIAERIVSLAVKRVVPRRGVQVAKEPDVAGEIARSLQVAPPLWDAPSGSVCALVGPPGAGKTTTILKIAGLATFAHRRSVAVITTDVNRLGNYESLEQYAAVMGFEVLPAHDREGLDRALDAFADVDLVLVDTPGHNPFDDDARYATLKVVGGREVRQHLVLPATLSSRVMADMIACYEGPALESLIITKIDEARGMGPVVAACFLAELPVSHVCDGQLIPDDIHAVDKDHVTREILLAHAS